MTAAAQPEQPTEVCPLCLPHVRHDGPCPFVWPGGLSCACRKSPAASLTPGPAGRDRYAQCHGDCTVDCGACKGKGRPPGTLAADGHTVQLGPVKVLRDGQWVDVPPPRHCPVCDAQMDPTTAWWWTERGATCSEPCAQELSRLPALPMSEAHKQALRDPELPAEAQPGPSQVTPECLPGGCGTRGTDRVVHDHNPPAEAQQDDEVERVAAALAEAADDGCFHRSRFTEEEWAEGAGEDDREWYRKLARAAVAARPSADAETLRDALRVHHPIMRSETGPFSGCRCGGVRLGQDVIAHVVHHLQAALDGTR